MDGRRAEEKYDRVDGPPNGDPDPRQDGDSSDAARESPMITRVAVGRASERSAS